MAFTGRGVTEGFLAADEVTALARDGLGRLPVDGRRVLVIIPDGTRTMPMPAMVEVLERELGPRTAALDYLVALGSHSPMSDEQLSRHLGRLIVDGWFGSRRVFNHRWDEPSALVDLGTIPAKEIAELTGGRFERPVPVSLNRLVTEYEHVLICGPVFPHEVVGFSGGTKYLFPGISAAEIIHFTHWLGAVMTSSAVIGTIDTPVRAVIDRAASKLATPISLMALVVTHAGIAGLFVGDAHDAWRQAAACSARRHIVWLDHPVDRILAIMPEMYDDLWTAAKGVYKSEPAVADEGEVIVFAPHVAEVSHVHGRVLDEIGYHCRDYFLGQWPRFQHYPGGILAHSTHVKGLGRYDAVRKLETPRIRVTLATRIPPARCARINLGYLDPGEVRAADWPEQPNGQAFMVPRAGELLFRVGRPPDSAPSGPAEAGRHARS